jgi:hypothetical protein
VGREFNVTRERIRQIEAKALRTLRHPSRGKKLKDYLDEGVEEGQRGMDAAPLPILLPHYRTVVRGRSVLA